MRFRGEKRQNTRRKCLKIFAHKVKFVGVCRAQSFTDRVSIFTKSVTNIFSKARWKHGTPYFSAGPPGSVLCISADLIPYEPVGSRKKPITIFGDVKHNIT